MAMQTPDMAPLAALAGGGPSPSPDMPESEPMGPEESTDPAMDDQIMLVEDFRSAPAEDAVAAFEALLAAFNVKRG